MNKPLASDIFTGNVGVETIFDYFDCDSFDEIRDLNCAQCYGYCFHKDKLVIVKNGKKNTWGPVGGTVESGETLEETLAREVIEESNMRITHHQPIGYQRATYNNNKPQDYQLRFYCEVEPIGPFVADPDHSIVEVKEIDPQDCKQYFDWKEIGDLILGKALKISQGRELGR